ncbi:MAG: hypothetical protein KGZ86_04795 [Candidatus Latescibacteria bacterium]|nr:hypothetical protein [Candidatus Latescibacterota bacterium]
MSSINYLRDYLRDRPLRSSADMAQAKAFEAETQYGIFAPCLQVKRLTDLITDYNAKGIPITGFIRYQPYPVVRTYRITDGKQPRTDISNKGKPPSEGGASPLVSHNKSEKQEGGDD